MNCVRITRFACVAASVALLLSESVQTSQTTSAYFKLFKEDSTLRDDVTLNVLRVRSKLECSSACSSHCDCASFSISASLPSGA